MYQTQKKNEDIALQRKKLNGNGMNATGIPLQMKKQIEAMSGLPLDDVRVHYNSDRPAQFQALAYTQGNQVYVGPGQEKHLSHELGHVVQQKRGMVRPTTHINGLAVNDDPVLEREAEKGIVQKMEDHSNVNADSSVIQRVKDIELGTCVFVLSKQAPGKVIGIDGDFYTIDLFNVEQHITVNESDVVPMHSNASKSNETFNSVMEHGVLSPKDMREKGLQAGAYTNDATQEHYNERPFICVNTFDKTTSPKKILGGAAAGALLVGLENSAAPKIKLPDMDKYRSKVLEKRPDLRDFQGLIERLCLQNAVNDQTEIIKPIFEERLKRTMLVIANGQEESEIGSGEDRVKSLPEEDTIIYLVPENGYVTVENEKIVRVSSKSQSLLVPAFYYFTYNDGTELPGDCKLNIDLNVPDYETELAELLPTLSPGKYHSHVVRL